MFLYIDHVDNNVDEYPLVHRDKDLSYTIEGYGRKIMLSLFVREQSIGMS